MTHTLVSDCTTVPRPSKHSIGSGRCSQINALDHYDLSPDTGCWIWRGKPTRAGHGQINRDGKTVTAHRYFYEQLVGEVPEGIHLHHTCPNRLCVNPAHLVPMTRGEHQAHHCRDKWERQKADPSLRLIGRAGGDGVNLAALFNPRLCN